MNLTPADILTTDDGRAIVDIHVRTRYGDSITRQVHTRVCWSVQECATGLYVDVTDPDLGLSIAMYAPGEWCSAEATRIYRKDDDPPEGVE